MSDLKGKTAIVTGAAVGLGNAYAMALAKEGVSLALCGLDAAKDRFHAHGQHLILSRAVGVRFMSMMHHFAEGLIPDVRVERH